MNYNNELKPNDVHNQTLVSNVHPDNWVNPTPEPVYNMVVVGAWTLNFSSSICLRTTGRWPMERAWALSRSWSGKVRTGFSEQPLSRLMPRK